MEQQQPGKEAAAGEADSPVVGNATATATSTHTEAGVAQATQGIAELALGGEGKGKPPSSTEGREPAEPAAGAEEANNAGGGLTGGWAVGDQAAPTAASAAVGGEDKANGGGAPTGAGEGGEKGDDRAVLDVLYET